MVSLRDLPSPRSCSNPQHPHITTQSVQSTESVDQWNEALLKYLGQMVG